MIPLNTAFWGLVLLFGIIGALRGWAQEIMVFSSVLLAMFVQQIFGQYILGPDNPYLPMLLTVGPDTIAPATYTEVQFYVCLGLLLVLAFFGYAGPTIAAQAGVSVSREQLRDALLGFIIGMLNGYLIFGMVWFYLEKTGYSLWGIQPPAPGSAALTVANSYLLPNLMPVSVLYLLVALAFVFVVVLFV
jgi:hypothetical protein